MKVLMLGWEYPPHITGGLGTACEGLTRALASMKVSVDFVVPRLMGGEYAPHMSLIDSSSGVLQNVNGKEDLSLKLSNTERLLPEGVEQFEIPAFLAPYWSEKDYEDHIKKIEKAQKLALETFVQGEHRRIRHKLGLRSVLGKGYGASIFDEVERYAENVTMLFQDRDFDIIHSHDWITFPAAASLAKITGKPLVVHVHSLETDRTGRGGGKQQIRFYEKLGMDAAHCVIAVSNYTARCIMDEHKIPPEKIAVIHNGLYPKKTRLLSRENIGWKGKIVLFLGRITHQKGPEYFVEAASRILPYAGDTLFVVAGTGDMLPDMIQRTKDKGIFDNFQFTGFLKGDKVDEMFSAADVYVMPSVSEPFGLTALEAINFHTPVVLSKQSGVSEVLDHALKVNYWDVEKMADLIINSLLYPELRDQMVTMARDEMGRLRWEVAALKTIDVYRRVLSRQHAHSLASPLS